MALEINYGFSLLFIDCLLGVPRRLWVLISDGLCDCLEKKVKFCQRKTVNCNKFLDLSRAT